jgi:drug/metabolite transporter (DMT)-like permease
MLRSRLLILGAAVCWSTAGAAIKLCGLSAWGIAGGRSLVAGLVLFAVFRAALVRPDGRLLAVALAYAATVVLFVLATVYTTAANAIFIQDMAPLYVMLLSPLVLGERPTRKELLAVPVYGAGLGLFFLDQLSPGQFTGNMLALASGVAFASCIVGLRLVRGDNLGAVAWGNIIAAGVALPFAFSGPAPTAMDAGLILYLGAVQLALGYALFSWGVHHVSAVEASLLILIEPVLNPIWTFLFAGERPGPWAIAGGAVILAATAWRTLSAAPEPSRA